MGFELPAMLPPPTLSFTIPSIQDDLVLQCRIYHPSCLTPTSVSQVAQWRKRAAIVAHPYAPLGGSYDDPVVDIVASTILKQGFVVGTFNFRGAGSSKGRTSWQSKPEQNDYISFIGFMIYYIHHLSPPALPIGFPQKSYSNTEINDLSPVPSQALPPPHLIEPQQLSPSGHPSTSSELPEITLQKEPSPPQTRLLIAGYSYGALVATCLPPIISSVIAPFQAPLPGSAHAEIRLRAECLAAQQNDSIDTQVKWVIQHSQSHKRGRSLQIDDRLACPKIRKSSGSIRIGGEEDLRRASHDSHRSRQSFNIETPERVRKSIDRVRSLAKSQNRLSPRRQNSHGSVSSYKSAKQGSEPSIKHITPPGEGADKVELKSSLREIPGIVDGLQTAYLLVSVPVGWFSGLATMWSSRPLGLKWKSSENDMKLTIDPTLVLFGDDDMFISVKRFRTWAEKLDCAGDIFRYREVPGAGHFWHDYEAIKTLREEVTGFTKDL